MDIIPPAPVKIEILGLPLHFNVVTLLNSWLVIGALILLGWLATRSLKEVPGRMQALFETVAEFFEDVCVSTLGKKHGRAYMPFIATIFLFVLLSNMVGTIPNVFGALGWPGFVCPTQDLNTPLGLALIVLVVVHVSAMRVKGFRSWLWSFYEPSFPADMLATKILAALSLVGGTVLYYVFLTRYFGAHQALSTGKLMGFGLLIALYGANLLLVSLYAFQLGRVPNVLMAPLNFVGEIGKGISHPFRLFGNIFGGFVILTVVSGLIMYVGLPPLLNAFFGIFIGLVQAFVFAMLALAYLAVQIVGE
jgi:F0F1-type ATP synthase membrane subunit a